MSGTDTDTAPHDWGSAPEFFGPRHEYRESLLRRQLLPVLPGGRILNAGCGGGSMTLDLLTRGYEVTSVDASPAFVAHVASQIAAKLPHLRPAPIVEVGDLHDLRFADAAFDAVVCGEVLEHLSDDASAARELARVLAPGGVLVASVPANPHRYDWVDRWAGHERRYTVDGLGRLLAVAGFCDVEVTSWGFPLTGLYHRWVYRSLLRRRLERGGDAVTPASPGGATGRLAHRAVRAALEVDTLFLGRVPGWFGLIARARTPQAA